MPIMKSSLIWKAWVFQVISDTKEKEVTDLIVGSLAL